MNLLSRVSIRIKLLLVAGVPVVGALLLALMIASDARQRAASAAALGSIEDLAKLSREMTASMHALQLERARVALSEGFGEKPGAAAMSDALELQYAVTDTEIARLESFLADRDLGRLPPRLSRGLATARGQMAMRVTFRDRARREALSIDEILSFYGAIDDALIDATAALAQLSDDGELLRSISSLVALSELAERSSAEHALLSYVFGVAQFPPGTFKSLVTLVTEQAVYEEVFRANATDEDAAKYRENQSSKVVETARTFRDRALSNTDETLDTDPTEYFQAQQGRMQLLHAIEKVVLGRIAGAASNKVAATHASIRLGAGLSALVVVVSALLAAVVLRGTNRSISALATSAAQVRQTKDFSVRARKTSTDELGVLTDAFNEMLSDIQERDSELEGHRTNLERLVAARTRELETRNESMRLVLDTVEQGLVTVNRDGTMAPERSAAFDEIVGIPPDGEMFADHIGRSDALAREMLKLSWDMAIEDVMPLEVVLDQFPKKVVLEGKHLALAVSPILDGQRFHGALVTVTDITSEVEARREEERQREYVSVFERVARDREGFIAFEAECERLIEGLCNVGDDRASSLAILHTIKGNTAQWGVTSVARLAHEVESQVIESGVAPSDQQIREITAAWRAITHRFGALFEATSDRLQISQSELSGVIEELCSGAPRRAVAAKLETFKYEPASVQFGRMTQEIERLAQRLDKPRPTVVIDAAGVRLPASRFGSFWSSCVHVIRNLVDHGIEPREERLRTGKAEAGTITLRAKETSTSITIELGDDGRGIDWDAIAAKAQAHGLPFETPSDLERAIFASGVSTAASVTDISGRGVGLSAVAERCKSLGGHIEVHSRRGAGARFVFVFPQVPADRASLAPMLYTG